MFKENLRSLRERMNLTQEQLGDKVGLSKSTISMYENGNREPDFETLEVFADFFHVDMNQLMGKRNRPDLPVSNIIPIETIQTKKFPLLGEIACGQPIFATEGRENYIEASADIEADFCLRVKEDSMMNAHIFDGDIVFIRKQPNVDNGEIAAIIINDEATLKRVYYYPNKNKLILNSENPAFEPLAFSGEELDEIRIIGKVVAFLSYIH